MIFKYTCGVSESRAKACVTLLPVSSRDENKLMVLPEFMCISYKGGGFILYGVQCAAHVVCVYHLGNVF
jgi:hypothetical protein